MTQPAFYETDAIVEWDIPCTLGEHQWRRVFCMGIGPICEGDLLDVMAETQVKNDLGYNLQIVSQIALLPGPTPSYNQDLYDFGGLGADWICKPAGENVNTERHYYQLSRGAKHKVLCAMPEAYVLLRVRAASTVADYRNVNVPYGYGKMGAFIWRC